MVGAETLSALGEESQIDFYRDRGVSSIDNVDTLSGRLALAMLLAGGQPGHYGLKDSGDGRGGAADRACARGGEWRLIRARRARPRS